MIENPILDENRESEEYRIDDRKQSLSLSSKKQQIRKMNTLPQNEELDMQIQQDIEKYLDMLKINPDWTFASKHGCATKPGIVNRSQDRQ